MDNKKRNNIILVIGIIIVVLTLFFIIDYYFRMQVNSCTSDPLRYAAKKYSDVYGFNFVGHAFLEVPSNYKSPIFYFDSENITHIVE